MKECRECGEPLPEESAGGCPACLLRLGLAGMPVDEGARGESPWGLHEPTGAGISEGTQLGRYRLMEVIGRGGMGVVYRALQEDLGREVAIKLLLGGEFAGGDRVERLRAEALVLGRLSHPGIVAIHEVGFVQGQVYLCMEWVRGGTLRELMAGGPLQCRRAAEIVRGIASAIQHAHEAGVWHRDLKPGNVLLDEGGRVRITDFGLAKLADGPSGLTVSGQVLGTPGYMAPEQADGRVSAIGPWTDIHAMGAILYQLLSGRVPFEGETLGEVMRRTLAGELMPVSRWNPRVPADLETICLKCLATEPASRYRTAAELEVDLENFLGQRPIQARRVGWMGRLGRWGLRHPALMVMGLLVVGLTLVSLVTVSVFWRRAESAARRAEAGEIQMRRALNRLKWERINEGFVGGRPQRALAGLAELLRADPEDRMAAERAWWALTWENHPLMERRLESHGAPVVGVAFTPGSDRVLSASADGRVWIRDPWDLESTPMKLEVGAGLVAVRMALKGERILTVGEEGRVQVWGGDGRQLRSWEHPGAVVTAEFSPDGSRVVTGCADGWMRIWRVAEEGEPVAVRHGEQVLVTAFDASGSRVVTGGRDGMARVWDAATGRPLSPLLGHGQRVSAVAFTPDAGQLVTGSWDGRVRLWNLRTGAVERETEGDGAWINGVTMDSTGGRVWFGTEGGAVFRWTRAGEAGVERVTRHSQRVTSMGWVTGEDGAEVVLSAGLDGSVRLWEEAEGVARGYPSRHRAGVGCAAFSGDGRWYVVGEESGSVSVWSALPGRANGMVLKHADLQGGVWSGDGARIMTHGEDRRVRVWQTSTGLPVGTGWEYPGRLVAAAFSRDGRQVLGMGRDGSARLWSVEEGLERELEPRHGRGLWTGTFSEDSTLAVTVSWDGSARLWDVETGRMRFGPWNHEDSLSAVAFAPGLDRVLTGSRSGEVRMWSTRDGGLLGEWKAHESAVMGIGFHRGGDRVVTTSTDRTARLWDVSGVEWGRELGTLRHEGEVMDVAFSADGVWMATGSKDGTAQVWEVRTGRPRGERWIHPGGVESVDFRGDGKGLMTACGDGRVRMWDVGSGMLVGVMEAGAGERGYQARFGPGNGRMLVWVPGEGVRVCGLPKVGGPVPGWFVELLEGLGEAGLEDWDAVTLRQRLGEQESDDGWVAWGKWFLGDRRHRSSEP